LTQQAFSDDSVHFGPSRRKKKQQVLDANPVMMPKKKKKYVDPTSMNDLQSVEDFRHFLLQNDSNFTDYVNSNLVLSIFDSHLMRESMISMMAQVLGSGQTKDNFFLLTR
jgi:hypothetical protein